MNDSGVIRYFNENEKYFDDRSVGTLKNPYREKMPASMRGCEGTIQDKEQQVWVGWESD